jgi:hypothetical protein
MWPGRRPSIWCALIGLFRSRAALEAEILVLRHQLNVLRRKSPKRLAFGNGDRLVFAGLYRVAPGVLEALKILKPQTVIRWHRAGFRAYWRWKSRPLGGRPKTPADIRHLIREMSVANPLWGAPRIHGERNPGHECSRNGHTGSAHRAQRSHGRTDAQRGSSDRSGGIVLTMSLCLASSTFVICSNRISNITTRRARTYHWRRTRRSPAPSRPSVRRWQCPSWAGCTYIRA